MYDLHAHRFRHTWVHLNLASGLQEHEAMVLAGWTTTNQLSRYGAAMAAQRAQAAAHARPVMQLVKAG